MLLRSSSTPVLGSLLSDNPNVNHHHQLPPEVPHTAATKHLPPTIPHFHNNKLSFQQGGSHHFTTYSCNSSPSIAERAPPQNGFRRAQSEGNLETLGNNEEPNISKPPKNFSRRPNNSVLQTIPSFSFQNSTSWSEDEDSDEDEEQEEWEENGALLNDAIRGELNMQKKMKTSLNDETRYAHAGFKEEIGEFSPQMYLARGLGVNRVNIGFGGGGGGFDGGGGDFFNRDCGDGDNDDDGNNNGLEEHYKRMVEENPGDPLFLRNYAQFLYQSKGDLKGAEEYYSRAILTDPKDGEILSQYAKLVWELHHDKERATIYFERAVQAASEDSHVHAAYASFLWQTEDEENEDEDDAVNHVVPPLLHRAAMTSATA